MLIPIYTKQFLKDVKKNKKRSKNFDKFRIIANSLIEEEALDKIHKDHQLVGNYAGRRECHIESDWLLIYKLEGENIIFERMGSHSDLFK